MIGLDTAAFWEARLRPMSPPSPGGPARIFLANEEIIPGEPIHPRPTFTLAEGGSRQRFEEEDVDELELRKECFRHGNHGHFPSLAVHGHKYRTIIRVGTRFYIVASVMFRDGTVWDSFIKDLRRDKETGQPMVYPLWDGEADL